MRKFKLGTFIRVRKDHPNFARRRRDSMVVKDFGEEVGLAFGFDRYNQSQECISVGTELWNKSELDLSTVDEPEEIRDE